MALIPELLGDGDLGRAPRDIDGFDGFYVGMDQYLYIPFLGEWTSINPSYFDVNRRGTRFWHTAMFFFVFHGFECFFFNFNIMDFNGFVEWNSSGFM
jgi:hypothetical protein